MKNLECRENLKNKVFCHMDKLKLPDFIVEEFWELEVFYSVKYLEKMLMWTPYEFNLWYESHDDYCMSNY